VKSPFTTEVLAARAYARFARHSDAGVILSHPSGAWMGHPFLWWFEEASEKKALRYPLLFCGEVVDFMGQVKLLTMCCPLCFCGEVFDSKG
jgi:hypothetical protein